MEIKRVIAGGLATLAAGATMVLGAGAVTLGDLVEVTGNTMTSPYIVIGDNAAAEDTLAAADVAVALAGQATETVSVSGAMATMAVSDGALIEKKSNKLYLTEGFEETLSKFTSEELPELLASDTIEVDDEDIDYTQRIYLTSNQKVTYDEGDDWDESALNLHLAEDDLLYTYELRFSPAVNALELGDVEIELLGRTYVFSDVEDANGGDNVTLFGSSQSETITAGETITVEAGGNDYTLTVTATGTDSDEKLYAYITVDGESERYYENDDIEEGDLEAHVKSINHFTYPTEYATVELFIGSQSTVLINDTEVEIGGESVDGADVLFTTSGDNEIKIIEIAYTLDDDYYLKSGESFTDLVFGTFEIALGGIYPGLDDASKDVVTFEPSAEDVEVTFTNLDGTEYEQVLFHWDSSDFKTSDGSSGGTVNFLNQANLTEDEYVVVSDNSEYSYILQFTDVSSDDEIILEDVATGKEYTITADDKGKDVTVGSLDVIVEDIGDVENKDEWIVLNNTVGGTAADQAWIITSNGAAFTPYINGTTGEFLEVDTDKVHINVTEDKQGFDEDDVAEATFVIELTESDDDVDANVVGIDTEGDEDSEFSYGLSKAGTYVVADIEDQDITTLYIPDEPTPVYVAFGTSPSFSSGEGVAAGTVEQAVQIKQSISKMESEVNTASLDRHLVLLGGPCANGLVAELLEMSATSPACSTEFTAEYPTEGVITVVEDAFSSGKNALVVAGVDRAATRDLAVKVMQGDLDYSA